MPKISIIVPVYQVEAYLDRCIGSVLHQTCQDFELILVDDGSPDNCPQICDRYALQDQRICVIHRKNGGLSAARNSGMDWAETHAESQWILFLDSDDWLHEDALRRLLTAAEEHEAQIAAGDLCRVDSQVEDPELGPLNPRILDPETAYAEHYGHCMTACGKLIRRELLRDLRFPEGKLHEDAFVTHKIIFGAKKVAVLEEPLYYYYFNPESITRAAWKPRRLEELEGHQVRLQYLLEHGYQKAARQERRVLIQTIYEQLETLARLKNKAYAPYFRQLRKDLRREMKEDRKLVPLDAETVWIYLLKWPARPLWILGKKLQDAYHKRNAN